MRKKKPSNITKDYQTPLFFLTRYEIEKIYTSVMCKGAIVMHFTRRVDVNAYDGDECEGFE
jgi:hypothetical protein